MDNGLLYQWGRKDAFPGADGSTITQATDNNAQTIPIYGASGNTLTEGSATGFRQVNITTNGVLNGNTSQVYAIKNPLAYIYGTANPRDWYTDTEMYQNHALWANNTKTNYDPCPKGWIVPTDATITYGDFSDTTFPASGSGTNVVNGRMYQSIAWFPAAGYYYSNSGSLFYVGSRSFYWSSSISNIHTLRLGFSMSGISLDDVSFRAYGFSVRCVQE